MAHQYKSNSNTQYVRQPSSTGGFLPNSLWGVNKLDAPAEKVDTDTKVCGVVFSGFEPSPIIATSGWPAFFSGLLNLLLHVACLTLTTVYAGMNLPPPNEMSKDYTKHHNVDFVNSWIVVMLVTEWLCVLWTLIYYGCQFKAMALPFAGHLGLGLQLIATVSAIKLSIWVAIAPTDDKSMRNDDSDGLIVAVMYLGLLVIAGYIMTPISGNYYKIVTNNLKDADAPKESWSASA